MKYASPRGFCQMELRNFLDYRLESESVGRGVTGNKDRLLRTDIVSSGTSFFLILDVTVLEESQSPKIYRREDGETQWKRSAKKRGETS